MAADFTNPIGMGSRFSELQLRERDGAIALIRACRDAILIVIIGDAT